MFNVKRSQSFRKKRIIFFKMQFIYWKTRTKACQVQGLCAFKTLHYRDAIEINCDINEEKKGRKSRERFFISINWLVFPYSVNKPLPLYYQCWWCKSKLITNGVVLIVVWSESDFNQLSSDDSAGRSWSQKLNPHNFERCGWFLCLSRISWCLFV